MFTTIAFKKKGGKLENYLRFQNTWKKRWKHTRQNSQLSAKKEITYSSNKWIELEEKTKF